MAERDLPSMTPTKTKKKQPSTPSSRKLTPRQAAIATAARPVVAPSTGSVDQEMSTNLVAAHMHIAQPAISHLPWAEQWQVLRARGWKLVPGRGRERVVSGDWW
jgi:hypothetical protein